MVIENKITKVLHELGVSSKLKGFYYIKDIIINVLNRKQQYFYLKDYYIELSDIYNSSDKAIEKCVRETIEKSFKFGNIDFVNDVFGYSFNSNKGNPTSAQFIITIVNYLRLN